MLRDYQKKAVENICTLFERGVKAVLLVMPTGTGKTRTAAAWCRFSPGIGLWIAHREELVEQAKEALDNPNVHVTTVQKLLATGDRPQADYVVWDEAHTSQAEEWRKVFEHYKDVPRLGLTATPERADGKPLSDSFEALTVGITIPDAISQGVLVPCEVVRPKRLLRPHEIAQSPLKAYQDFSEGRQTIVFANNIANALRYLYEFEEAEIPTGMVTGDMPRLARKATIEAFRIGAIRVLINVNVLTEGFDHPPAAVCILARGADHHGIYLQMVGRVLRPAEGKTKALVVDLRGITHVLGAPDAEREYSLLGRAGIALKGQKPDVAYCAVCGTLKELCSCGYVAESKPMRVVNSKLELYERFLHNSESMRIADYVRWLNEARRKGYKDGSAWFKYKVKYREMPPKKIVSAAFKLALPREDATTLK